MGSTTFLAGLTLGFVAIHCYDHACRGVIPDELTAATIVAGAGLTLAVGVPIAVVGYRQREPRPGVRPVEVRVQGLGAAMTVPF